MASQDPPSQHRIRIASDASPDGQRLELPFVIGVLGDFSGMPASPLAHLRRRRFVDVDLDNIDDVLQGCSPRLAFRVENKLDENAAVTMLNVELHFRRLEDFSPEGVALQIKPLAGLLELRNKLAELRTALQAKDGLDELLQETVNDEEKLKQLEREVTGEADPAAAQSQNTEREPPPTRSAGVVRRNWREPAAQPEEFHPGLAPEPGVWSAARVAESASILDQLVEVRRSQAPWEKERSRELIKQFVAEVVDRNNHHQDSEAMINARIAQIDYLVSVQLNEVLHNAEFQRLEANWRGLHFLLHRVRKAGHVKVRVLNAGKKELLRQFQRERERYTSPVARRLLEEAFGTPGATPFSLLIGAFEVGRTPEDVDLVEKLARLCAVAHLPFLAAASPSLLGFDDFTKLTDAEMLSQAFETAECMNWNSFRARIESRYIGLVLPGMMMRLPYGSDSHPIDAFNLEEGVDGTDHSKFLWGSAVWALAARFALDFERYGWCGAPRESGDAGEIRDLPHFRFRAHEGDIGSKGPAEIAIGEKLYLDLRALGVIPLCQIAETDSATFYESWSCHKPRTHPDADPPTTYESAQMDCMLDVSRIAHSLHAILRESCQKLASAQQCEERLREWIATYVVPDYARGTSFEAAFPLLGADFRVASAPDPRGKSKLEASLLPKRPGAPLAHSVEIAIEIALPWALAQDPPPQPPAVTRFPATPPAISFESPNGGNSGRDQFIRSMLMAEACLANRKLDVAAMILEDLTEQIDRYHLEEWESPRLVTHVWGLLRRCYLLASPAPEAAERSVALLRRICRLDPTRAIE
jgi:type VI secretion system protein ImpC